MDAVTYPEPSVQDALSDVVAVHYNVAEPDAATREKMREYRMVWTPTLIWLDHHGIELRRDVGYIAPQYFLGLAQLAKGAAHLLHANFDLAEAAFLRAGAVALETAVVPEALYWAGVAALRRGSREDFLNHWRTLFERFPDSMWWSRASFVKF